MTSDRQNIPGSPNEMVDAWIKAATEAERRWNEYYNQQMGTEAFAEAMARQNARANPFQAMFDAAMERQLRSLNIPTQRDYSKLAERVTDLERRLDALTIKDGNTARSTG